jgi:hypothetical protein
MQLNSEHKMLKICRDIFEQQNCSLLNMSLKTIKADMLAGERGFQVNMGT